MTSPFPGVDPYLEAQGYWPDFHGSFIYGWRDALNEVLPDHYEARVDERLTLIEQPAEKFKRIEPDVVITWRGSSRGVLAAPAGVGVIEPVTVPLIIEEETRETFIEIRRLPERTVVATLELLSPANKEEPGRRSYLDKRNALLHRQVHLVELDFLLGGRRLPLSGDYPAGNYFALVSHAVPAELQRVCLDDPAASPRHPDPAPGSRSGGLDRPGRDLRADFPARPIRSLDGLRRDTVPLASPGRAGVGPSGGLRGESLKSTAQAQPIRGGRRWRS